MTAIDDRRRGDLRPALLAALALHLGLFAFFVAIAKPPSIPPTGSAVPSAAWTCTAFGTFAKRISAI